jgi:hypothetical protein
MAHNQFEFPSIIKRAIHGLDNERRWKILETIMNKGDLSYSSLISELNYDNKGLLNFHLKNLLKSALIERYEDLSSSNADRSYYTISEIGMDIINALLDGLRPSKKIPYFTNEALQTAAISREKIIYDPFYETERIDTETPEIQPLMRSTTTSSAI